MSVTIHGLASIGGAMARGLEDTFGSWSQPPGETEQGKCENAEGMVCKALNGSRTLSSREIVVFTQGSYRNRTNVRDDSDVDICALCTDLCLPDYTFAPGLTNADVDLISSPYSYLSFKNDVGSALFAHFGSEGVKRGTKAFDVHANTYRVDADVVPCFEYRQYERNADGSPFCHYGTVFIPDGGERIVNWPEQHYRNGVTKNSATGRSFKGAVRILKRIRNEMADARVAAAIPIASYLIECLTYNVPNDDLTASTWEETIERTLAHVINSCQSDDDCREWLEVNEMKYLLRGGQPWTRQEALAFAAAAWEYLGF